MQEHFNIFQEITADRKFCPNLECTADRDDIINLVDWDRIDEAEDMNSNGEAALVLGYYKLRENGSKTKYFTRVITIDSKTNQKVLLQHHPEEKYDLIMMHADMDETGKPLVDIADQIIGCIKVSGPVAETLVNHDGTPNETRVFGEIMKDIALPVDGKIRIFETHIPSKKKPAKKRGRKSLATSVD